MQYYDLLSSEERERIKNEILLDKMEEAEEIRNSLPNGFVSYHDDDNHDHVEEPKWDDDRKEESDKHEHRPYGHRFRNKNGNRRVGYNKQNNNREKDHIKYDKNGKPIVKSYAVAMGERARREYEKKNRRKSSFNPYANRHRQRSNSDEDIVYVGYGSMRRAIKRKDLEAYYSRLRARIKSNKP